MPGKDAKAIYMRDSLNQALRRIWDYPLTVVEAPMGYGKTTAVREFFKGRESEALWQTVANASAAGFWRGFSRLFAGREPVRAARLAQIGVPGDSVLTDEAVELIGNMSFPARLAVVIDDYHLLSTGNIDRFFERLAKARIPNLHIVLVTRSEFGDNTAELALKGYCQVIDKSRFELTQAETVEFCRLRGVRLTAEDAVFLHAYTEGWISAVYLCILGYLQDGRLERQASLSELIEKAVYRPYPAEVKEFLLSVCVFDRFSLAQAEHMWRKGDAEPLLRQLMAENAFIRFDRAGQTYCLHNIFANYLRQLFDRENSDRRQALWKRAGEWHLGAGDCILAAEYFYRAGDFDGLLTAIEADRGGSIAGEHKQSLIRYFGECPAAIKMRHLWACLIFALNMFLFAELPLFVRQCAEIDEYLAASPALDDGARARLAGELELLKSFGEYNRVPAMAAHHEEAWRLLQGPASFIDTSGSWTFGSPSVLYMLYRESGKLEQEVGELAAAMPCYCRLTDGHGAGGEHVMAGERYYHIGDFENAEIAAHEAMFIAQSRKQPSIALAAMFLQVRLALARGDGDYVLAGLRQAREALKRQGLYSYMPTLDLGEGFVFACLGQPQRIPAWIARGELQESSLFLPAHAFFNIVWGKALLLGGYYQRLIGIAGQFIAAAAVFPNLLAQVYAHIYEAAAADRLGRRREASAALDKALAIAAPDGLVMPFAENGEYIADLLAAAATTGPYAAFAARILAVYPPLARHRQAIAEKLNNGGGEPRLTAREAEIAGLVAAGLSNEAIGQRLHIAKITVKKALGNIFAKLGVSNRAALARIITERRSG
jgi:LuxR family maltose regulon positive regulatory protein